MYQLRGNQWWEKKKKFGRSCWLAGLTDEQRQQPRRLIRSSVPTQFSRQHHAPTVQVPVCSPAHPIALIAPETRPSCPSIPFLLWPAAGLVLGCQPPPSQQPGTRIRLKVDLVPSALSLTVRLPLASLLHRLSLLPTQFVF